MGRLKADLEIHIKKAHSKECEITPEFRIEKQNYESKCDLCKKQFKNRNQLVEHWEEDHEAHIYICIHLECRTKYICQKLWKEHMKKNHGIGLNCPQCNEFYYFEEQLEEHLEEHIEREEYIEPNEFQREECNEFFSREDAINHENESECDQCGKWLGCEKNVQTHKLREHKIINKKENKDSHEPNIIRADKDKFINETRIKEKDVIEMFKIVSENPDREIETTKKQDKTKEKTTKDTPIDKNKTKQKFLER